MSYHDLFPHHLTSADVMVLHQRANFVWLDLGRVQSGELRQAPHEFPELIDARRELAQRYLQRAASVLIQRGWQYDSSDSTWRPTPTARW